MEFLMKYIVSKKEDLNGMTALHAAAHDGRLDVVKLCLDKGISAKVQDTDESTPLHYLVMGNMSLDMFTQILNVLLQDGANINSINWRGYNVLFQATYMGMPKEFLELLVASGAVWKNIRTRYFGETIVHLAAQPSNFEALNYFVKELKADVNVKDENGNTPLLCSANIISSVKVAKFLLQNGADVTAVNDNGESVLHLAAQNGKAKFLKCFISHPDVNAIAVIDKKGNTALHHAVGNIANFFEMVKFLVRSGFNINAVNADGESVLYRAVRVGKSVLELKFLLDHGANLNVSNHPGGFSILHAAVNFERLEALSFLLSQNEVEVDARNNTQDTPLLLTPFGNTGVCERIHGLLDAGTDINASNEDGDDLIFIAVENGKTTNQLEQLVGFGADFDKRNNRGDSVLHVAARVSNLDAFKFFLRKGMKLRKIEVCKDTVITQFWKSLSGQTVLEIAKENLSETL